MHTPPHLPHVSPADPRAPPPAPGPRLSLTAPGHTDRKAGQCSPAPPGSSPSWPAGSMGSRARALSAELMPEHCPRLLKMPDPFRCKWASRAHSPEL